MKFTERSKSLRRKASRREVKKAELSAEEAHLPAASSAEHDRRKSVCPPRPKSSHDRKSFQRPRTANKQPSQAENLHTAGQTIEIREGDDTFYFPTPSPRLPPTRNARYHPTPSPLAGTGSPLIGVALGSPTAEPPWGRSYTADVIAARIPHKQAPHRAPPTISEQPPDDTPKPGLRRKKSGWKTLGALFQRKPSKPTSPQPFYRLQIDQESISAEAPRPPLESSAPATMGSPGPTSPESLLSTHSRTPSLSRGLARFEARAEADRASFMLNREKPHLRTPSMVQRQSMQAVVLHGNSMRGSDAIFDGRTDHQNKPLPDLDSKAISSTPRLDLDIPKGELERYSVMFEKLLDPKPSILERRAAKTNATADDRQPSPKPLASAAVPNAGPLTPQRSLTTPHLSISISKPASSGAKKLPKPDETLRPIQRSKTAPPGSVSPVCTSAPRRPPPPAVTHVTPNFSRPGRAPTFSSSVDSDSPMVDENSLPPTPTSFTSALEMHDASSIKVVVPNDGAPMQHTNEALDVAPPSPPAKQLAPRVESPKLVQVSVARQVSVSRARRQAQAALATAENCKQPLRPRVVELGPNAKVRKSTMVLIEGGEEQDDF